MRRRDVVQRVGECVVLLSLLLGLAAGLALPAAASPSASHTSAAAGRPARSVAYARVALVRVLSYYAGTLSGDTTPIPWPNPCIAEGALIGTTGSDLNSFSYVLLPTAAVNPLTPCPGVQAAFAQVNGRAGGWSITRITVLLDAAYTGTTPQQVGSLSFNVDPAQISTNGGPSAPALLALALTPGPGAPGHDLPLVTTPQPQDPPAASSAAVLLDLTRHDGQPLRTDTLAAGDAHGAVYPISVPASALSAGSSGSTESPSPPSSSPLAQLGLGAPEIDSNGRIIGMVAEDSRGNRYLAGLTQIAAAIGPINGNPGALATLWSNALDAYYATPPRYEEAATDFGKLAASYPDFAGALPFGIAATQHSTAIPPLTTSQPSSGVVPQRSAISPALIAVLAAGGSIIVVVLLSLVQRSRSRPRHTVPEEPLVPLEEARLDLLPADLPLAALDDEDAITQVVPLVSVPGANKSTSGVPDEIARRSRAGLPLMPYAAGQTDVGIRRRARPNQDSILALHGVRYAQGRPQTYGIFIVADGMGGHDQGLEASETAIQIVAHALLKPLTDGRLLDDAQLADLLTQSALEADAELQRRNTANGGNMGTTLTAVLVLNDLAVVANAGDSRTYLLSPETGLCRVTTDHSVVARLAEAGIIKPEDIYTHPRRNQIYRSLGGQHDETGVDTFLVPLQAGDKLLLCSDGLWEMVRDPQIASILRGSADPRRAVELLVREANTNGGEDNIAAVVVRLLEDLPDPIQPGPRVLASSVELDLPRRAEA
jgi:serine/threonine protein phosphatase PrpC